jgi:hypothetical protein
VKYEEVYLKADETVTEARRSIGIYLNSTTENDLTPALTAYRRISSTITTCGHYPWPPETMQESTYKLGLAVQTTGGPPLSIS